MRMQVAAKEAVVADLATFTEPWYGTAYGYDDIPENLIATWRAPALHAALKLPVPNDYVPTDFELKPLPEEPARLPQCIGRDDMSLIWHKQDNVFLQPKTVIRLMLSSPVTHADVRSEVQTSLFASLVVDSLIESAYAAELAGISYSISTATTGIKISLRGVSAPSLPPLSPPLPPRANNHICTHLASVASLDIAGWVFFLL